MAEPTSQAPLPRGRRLVQRTERERREEEEEEEVRGVRQKDGVQKRDRVGSQHAINTNT